MVKTKKILAYCSLCKATINLEIPVNIVDEKKFFPFEYIFIHGKPEHALMLFLDANLSVRDEIVYQDLLTAKKQAKEFSSLIHMTEIEALASIYNEPMRTEILRLLSEGPIKSDELIEALNNFPEFDQKNFQLVILPLIKTNLVKSRWLHETFFECFFLVKDFVVFKVPHKQTIEIISKNPKFSVIKDSYLKKATEILRNFRKKILSRQDQIVEDMITSLRILTSKEYKKIMTLLGNGPISLKTVRSSLNIDALTESFISDIFYVFNINGEKYCSIVYDLRMQYFLPRNLMNKIASNLMEKKISHEMANTHLDLLFESEKELKIIRKKIK